MERQNAPLKAFNRKFIFSLPLLILLLAGCAATMSDTHLVDCDHPHVQCVFDYPKGYINHLLLAMPQSDGRKPFSGQVQIADRDGKPLCTFPVSDSTAERCNWLAYRNLDAYILTWRDADEWHKIQPGRQYTLTLAFTQMPPAKSSVWLSVVR